MKTFPPILALAAVLAIASVAHADYELRMTITLGDGTNQVIDARLKGALTKLSLPGGRYIVTDTQAGTRYQVDTVTKKVLDLSDAYKKARADLKPAQDRPQALPTGKKDTFQGLAAEEYECIVAGTHYAYWVVPDYPKEKAQVVKTIFLANFGATSAKGPDLLALPGPVLRTVATGKDGELLGDSVVTSIEQVLVEDKEFAIPADYEMKKVPAR